MKNRKINYGLIIFIGVIIIIFIPIIRDYIKNQNIQVVSKSEIQKKISNKESFVLYVGDLEKKDKKDLAKLKDLGNENTIAYSIYNIDKESAKGIADNAEVAMYIDGDLQKSLREFNYKKINELINIYYVGKIDDENKSYKVAENFAAYKELVNSDTVTMAVFGRNSCSWCNKFKPVYNAVAEKYDIDIYYFDSDNYDNSEYEKIINMDLTIPSKCNDSGKEFKLSDGFGTPLSIFTKDGEVVDCISGYTDRASLIDKLKTNNIISE